MGVWQLVFFCLGAAAGDHVGETEGLVRLSAAAGALAMLATLPIARVLLRRARASIGLAFLLLPIGAGAIYLWVPRAFLYVKF